MRLEIGGRSLVGWATLFLVLFLAVAAAGWRLPAGGGTEGGEEAQKRHLDLELEEFRHRLREVAADAARTEGEILRLQAALDRQAPRLAYQVRSLYKVHRRDRLGDLLSAPSLAAFERRKRSLFHLFRRDVERMRQWRETLASLERRARLLLRVEELLEALYRDMAWNLSAALRAATNSPRLAGEIEADKRDFRRLHEGLSLLPPAAVARLCEAVEARKGFEASKEGSADLRRLRGELPWPATGALLMSFGLQRHPRIGTKLLSRGIDIDLTDDPTVRAIADGRVLLTQESPGLVILDHGHRIYTIYGNLSRIDRGTGAWVRGGEPVGE
ncbi:MAG: hypothetical protein D6812_03610, partial [Deltaproteobacteria bacterium]